MKLEIEVYKNQTIYYNDDSDKFECAITVEEQYSSKSRKSLKEIRREIDLFIKANLEFKPFKCLYTQYVSFGNPSVKNCTAIRTDGSLVIDGSQVKQSEWNKIYNYSSEYETILKNQETETESLREKHKRELVEANKLLTVMNLDRYKK